MKVTISARMGSNRCLVVAVCALAVLSCAAADNAVYIRSRLGQLVTSSTLHWVTGTGDTGQLRDAVIGANTTNNPATNSAELRASYPVYVCRAIYQGVWFPGHLRYNYNECIVYIYSSVTAFKKYEILQNLEGGAFLSWMPWDKYTIPPTGAVAAIEGSYVARRKVPDDEASAEDELIFSHYIGQMDPKEGLGKITYVNNKRQAKEVDTGEILVETEPIKYELKNIKPNNLRKRSKRTHTVIGERVLLNDGAEGQHVASEFEYSYNYSMYWGQGHAILTGLNMTVRTADGTWLEPINWGTPYTAERKELYSVKRYLDPGTACNVTLHGNYTITDQQYSATLVAYYPNEAPFDVRRRVIHGERQIVGLMDVTADYGPVYFLANDTLVPTTTTSTTTTTTTTTTTEAPPAVDEKFAPPKKVAADTESVVRDKGENNSMLSDESDAQSLLKKTEGAEVAGADPPHALSPAPAACTYAPWRGARAPIYLLFKSLLLTFRFRVKLPIPMSVN